MHSSSPGVTLISCLPSRAAEGFVVLAECLGVPTKRIDLRGEPNVAAALAETQAGGHALVVDFAGFGGAPPATVKAMLDGLRGIKTHVLLLITDADEGASRHLASITADGVSGVFEQGPATSSSCRFAGLVSAELNGQRFPRASSSALCLSVRDDAFETIVSIDGNPCFGRLTGSSLYVWSTPNVFDMRRPLDEESPFELATEEYVPAMIFLRSALGERCWHTRGSSAAVIIDDPLLRRRYGALDFQRLLPSARQHRYHVTLAFIPWNHWRTKKKDAGLFTEYRDVFSVCAHGNDHTSGEFFSDDFEDLCARITEAQSRFAAHEARTGVPHEWLMVWPQERYSAQALRALANNGRFVAVSNTRCIPDDPAAKGRVSGADLILPASDRWFGLPILKRHYLSEGMGKFALALFFGRPAVLATHHEFFKTGADRIEKFVAATRQLDPTIEWKPITRVLRRLCWQRRVAEHHWEIRFFADEFELDPHDGRRNCSLVRRIPPDTNVEGVTVNGDRVDYSVRDELLRIESPASNANSGIRVRIQLDRKNAPTTPRVVSAVYRTRVAMRRIGSELRDYFASGA